jgi:hypothetical protein
MRRLVASSVALSIVLSLLNVAPAAAADNGSCTTTQKNRWSQNWVSGTKQGAYAQLDGQALHQCSSPNFIQTSGSFAFVNVSNNSYFNNIVQIGVGICREPGINDCDSTMRIYWAYGRDHRSSGCSGYSDRTPGPALVMGEPVGNHTYKVYHTLNQWRYYVDGVLQRSQGESDICWTPTSASWFGESWDYGDAIGGSTSNKFGIGFMQYANSENGGFVNTNFSVGNCKGMPTETIFKCHIDGSTVFSIWTAR